MKLVLLYIKLCLFVVLTFVKFNPIFAFSEGKDKFSSAIAKEQFSLPKSNLEEASFFNQHLVFIDELSYFDSEIEEEGADNDVDEIVVFEERVRLVTYRKFNEKHSKLQLALNNAPVPYKTPVFVRHNVFRI